ncbi:GNAT family N-acetyltransferase [Kordiimonas laminariae]|uniref:GNAT family N-acetyltransferase n=1 Tax=Kordiimonas laminariae TaxID=2917717 RepID=UPI001FF27F41|nr:GNAT family protein [Kordiimonas laminariae]MCK0070192.1 GNAT family N-acetyltransferase [Kordiimonas laminariae]
MNAHIRDIEPKDFQLVLDYFLKATDAHLLKMGVDKSKLPKQEEWLDLLMTDYQRPSSEKQAHYLMWELDGTPIGHSSINKLTYGEEGYIHLHVWNPLSRKSGLGSYFISESISRYFEQFNLKQIRCEPNAQNESPNKTLAKTGFEFTGSRETIPGWINFHQKVNSWLLSKEKWKPETD